MSYTPKMPSSMRNYSLGGRLRAPIFYVSFAELYIWVKGQHDNTQEGEPYHEELTKFTNAFKKIAKFFDGSLGTYTDPVSRETKSYPTICTYEDLLDYYYDAFNTRYIYFPIYDGSSLSIGGTVDDATLNSGYSTVNEFFCRRVDWFCKFKSMKYLKLIQTLGITYNPLADFWRKSEELGGGAPQATIGSDSEGKLTITDWGKDSTNGDVDGRLTTSQQYTDPNNKPTSKNYTTTYDDASLGRLNGYTTSEGGNVSNVEATNTGYFKKFEEEGNKGSVILEDMIQKELELAPFWDIVIEFCSELNNELLLTVWS